MKRKFITLEIYADDNDIDDSVKCIVELLEEINSHWTISDRTIDIKVSENHLELYRQLGRKKSI